MRLAALAERTRFITVIVDACHSGTITRDALAPGFGVRARSVPPDLRPASELPPSPVPAAARSRGEAGGASGGWSPLADAYVLVAGCRDDERSYEYRAPVDDGAGGGRGTVTHGALTYFLAQELRAVRAGTTYRDVYERAAARVTAANGEQHPQLEGRADLEVLGVRDVAPVRGVRVLAADGDRVTLETGAALGAAAGARYAVYAAGTKAGDGAAPLGEAELVAVGAVSSEARLLAGAGAVAAGARAVPTSPGAGARLRVQCVVEPGAADPDGAAGRLGGALAASPLVEVAAADAPASVRVYLLAPRGAPAAGGTAIHVPPVHVPQLGALAAATWAVVGDSGQLLAPPKPIGATDDVLANVETIARYRRTLALTNPDPGSALAGRFTVELLRRTAAGGWEVAPPGPTGMVEYEEGDRIGFRVTSRHDAPVYLNLLDFGLTGRVSLVYPPPGARDTLGAGVTFDLVGQPPANLGWPVTWPAALPFGGAAAGAGVTDAVETVKLFAATGPADFSFLTQRGVRAVGPAGRATALERLARAAAGAVGRDIGDPEPTAAALPADDWTTVERAFVVRRRQRAALGAGGAPATVGGATLRATGITGSAAADSGGAIAPAAGAAAPDDALAAALGAAGATVRQTIVVTAAPAPAGAATRDVAPRAVDVTVADPGAGFGQLLVSTDAAGVVRFHFAPEADGGGAAAARGVDAPATRTFHVPVPATPADAPAAPGERGVLDVGVARLVLKHVVFPLIDPLVGEVAEHYAAAWEARHRPYRVRPFDPDNYAVDDVAPVDADGWRRLAAGRALLFVHGTFSRASSAFGALPASAMAALHEAYGGRVFAFDHPSLSEDPEDNVRWLVGQIPDGTSLDVDVVCHSRGGLVSRVLAERQGELLLGSRAVRVGKVVFVGAPNAGTLLADADRMGTLIDTYATLLNLIPEPAAREVLQAVVTVAKQLAVGACKGLPGLQAMRPGGPFAARLNAAGPAGAARYFALASAYTPRLAGLRALLEARAMDKVFAGANDLVVPTAGVWDANGSGWFPIEQRRVFVDGESCAHTEYFASRAAQAQLLAWLTAA